MGQSPHPLVEPLIGLVGTWVGEGHGSVAGDDPFRWTERLEVGHTGTPALWFRQRTRRPDGSPFHAEDGWVRVPPELQVTEPPDASPAARTAPVAHGDRDLVVEGAVVSATGVLEALAGSVTAAVDALTLDLASTQLAGTPAAATVLTTRRRWVLDGDALDVDFWMATPAHPETFHHLSASLQRSEQQ